MANKDNTIMDQGSKKREKILSVRMDRHEYDDLKSIAADFGMPVATLTKWIIKRWKEKYHIDPEKFRGGLW